MIEKVLKYLNHYYPIRMDTIVRVVSDGVEGNFQQYFAGQYVRIVGSVLNDGVYKLLSATDSKLTIDAVLIPEEGIDIKTIYGLAIPRDLLSLITEIETYGEKDESVTSESIDDYSVSYGTGAGWQNAFKGKLQPYKRVYPDIPMKFNYNWQKR